LRSSGGGRLRAALRGAASFGALAGSGPLVLAGLASIIVALMAMFAGGSTLGSAYIVYRGRAAGVAQHGGLDAIYAAYAAVGSVILGSLLYYLSLGGGGGVRLVYAYTGSPRAALAGLSLSWLLSGVGMSAPLMLYLVLHGVSLGDALALALGLAVDVAGVALALAVASGRFEGFWPVVAGAVFLVRFICSPQLSGYCAVSSVSYGVVLAVAGQGYWYLAAGLAAIVAAPLAVAGRWGRP